MSDEEREELQRHYERLEDEITDLLFELDSRNDTIRDLDELMECLENDRDKLRAENAELVNELSEEYNARAALDRDWVGVTDALRERAETAEAAITEIRDAIGSTSGNTVELIQNLVSELAIRTHGEAREAHDLRDRANSWFEIAKQLVREKRMWVDIAEQHLDSYIEADTALDELKVALRILSR